MTDTQIRIVIAEACGWTKIKMHPNPKGLGVDYDLHYGVPPDDKEITLALPDYPNDLNAMQHAWNTLGWQEKNECVENLRKIVREADCEAYFATARQRAEAFIKTVCPEKWIEPVTTGQNAGSTKRTRDCDRIDLTGFGTCGISGT